MTHNHEAQAAALQKLQELITAIAEATKALPRVLPPQPTQTPRDIERRIVEAVTARERISFGDLGRLLGEPKQRIHHHTHAVARRPNAPIVIVKRPSADFMRDLLYAYDRRRLPDDLDSPGPAPAEAVGSATAGALGEHTEQDDTPI
jgi:hypothetical protein